MKRLFTLLIFFPLLTLAVGSQTFDKDGIPVKPRPERLVNIIGEEQQLFTTSQITQLESNLSDFSKSTGVQIVLVVTPNLHGYEINQVATEIGHKWGVGQKGKDNGIVVLLKPKTTSSKGQVFIATGYGLEGVIPDAIGKRIVEVEMIPEFRKGDYYTGVLRGLETLKSLALKEFSAKEYLNKTDDSSGIISLFPLILIFVLVYAIINRRRKRHIGSSSIPFWTAMWLGGSISRGSAGGGWSDFSSGSGGFGGFGGGGFGGGGAGGSW